MLLTTLKITHLCIACMYTLSIETRRKRETSVITLINRPGIVKSLLCVYKQKQLNDKYSTHVCGQSWFNRVRSWCDSIYKYPNLKGVENAATESTYDKFCNKKKTCYSSLTIKLLIYQYTVCQFSSLGKAIW